MIEHSDRWLLHGQRAQHRANHQELRERFGKFLLCPFGGLRRDSGLERILRVRLEFLDIFGRLLRLPAFCFLPLRAALGGPGAARGDRFFDLFAAEAAASGFCHRLILSCARYPAQCLPARCNAI